MSDTSTELTSLLFESGGALKNIKFFPGHGRDITPADVEREAAKVIRSSLGVGFESIPPSSGRSTA